MNKSLAVCYSAWDRIVRSTVHSPDLGVIAFIQDSAKYENTIHLDRQGNLLVEYQKNVPLFQDFAASFFLVKNAYRLVSDVNVAIYSDIDDLLCKVAAGTRDKILVAERGNVCTGIACESIECFRTGKGRIGMLSSKTHRFSIGEDASNVFEVIHHLVSRREHKVVYIEEPYLMRNGTEKIFEKLVSAISAKQIVVKMLEDTEHESYPSLPNTIPF